MDYNYKEIEKKWQNFWDSNKTFKTDIRDFSKPKFYALDMFPYPSGVGLHAGHPEGYTATDIISRMKRMQGYNVLHPMGYDSFGLPAEQYAVQTGNHPSKFTDENIETFTKQLKELGFDYDWDRVVATSDPSFYKWTQWIFKQLYNDGYAKYIDMPVNWCEELGTVLSNDEVIDGKSERGGYPVIRKNMRQLCIDQAAFAEKLLEGLETIDWPNSTKEIQKNWIGKSIGAHVDFVVDGYSDKFTVFTTRCDTLFGATYCVLAPEHELVDKITTEDKRQEVADYKAQCALKNDMERTELNKEKTGVFTGAYAINPVNDSRIPIYISDYVLSTYGTGAIMAVPAHDDRDYEFAKKFNIPIVQVLAKSFVGTGDSQIREDKPMTNRNVVNVVIKHPSENKYLCVHNKKFNWINFVMGGIEGNESVIEAGIREVVEETGYTDIKIDKELEFIYFDNFYAAHKDVNRHITCHTIVGHLNSLEQVSISDEEKVLADYLWIDESELIDSLTTEAHKYDARRVLNGEGAMTEDGVHINSCTPLQVTGTPHENEFKKNSIVAIVYDEKNDKYLTINWKDKGGRLFIGGSINDGETPLECALREVAEETGYKNLEFISELPKINHHYYAFNKDKYFNIISTGFLFKLIDDEKGSQNLDEDEEFSVEWVSKEVIESEIKDELHIETYKHSKAIDKIDILDLNDLLKSEAIEKTISWLEEHDKGSKKVNYKMREWIFARQRYWGEPVPIVHMEDGTDYILEDQELPLCLPELDDYKGHNGLAPLENASEWKKYERNGVKGVRETSTMPGSAGSSWYFLRYIDPKNEDAFADQELLKHWMPVDLYVGGPEHAVGHLMYSRIWNRYLYDKGLSPVAEPFKKLVHQGMILGENGIKMGKRFPKYVINPSDIIRDYGADTLRLYEMFMGPLEASKPWSSTGVEGAKKFLDRIWRLYTDENRISDSENKNLEKVYHATVKKVTSDYEALAFNTAISQLMVFINAVYKEDVFPREYAEGFIKLLNPIAPHITEELWNIVLGHDDTIAFESWPEFDESKIVEDFLTIGVQVNGKLRGTITVPVDSTEEQIKEAAFEEENVKRHTDGKEIVKVIVIKGKIVNIVIK